MARIAEPRDVVEVHDHPVDEVSVRVLADARALGDRRSEQRPAAQEPRIDVRRLEGAHAGAELGTLGGGERQLTPQCVTGSTGAPEDLVHLERHVTESGASRDLRGYGREG